MNILVIGNGFDLAHGLPTLYKNFLEFFHGVKNMPRFSGDINSYKQKLLAEYSDRNSEKVRELLQEVFSTRNPRWNPAFPSAEKEFDDPVVQEIYDNLDKNIWYEYLSKLHKEGKINGINWIDFESEISHIIECFDRTEENLYTKLDKSMMHAKFPNDTNLSSFLNLFDKCNLYGSITYRNFLDESYEQLRKFVYCMELYLHNYVENRMTTKLSPDIQNTNPNAVLCFNYTHTFVKRYGAIFPDAKIQYIHGETKDADTIETNNMVLGIDEYYKGEERDTYTNYNIYKKFTQRVINETGFKYREWIHTQNGLQDAYKYVFVFGHSLAVTDKDILKDLIDRKGVKTTVYYHDKQQQTQQIANLVKMLGQDKFIQMINSIPQQITFVKQQDMITVV